MESALQPALLLTGGQSTFTTMMSAKPEGGREGGRPFTRFQKKSEKGAWEGHGDEEHWLDALATQFHSEPSGAF